MSVPKGLLREPPTISPLSVDPLESRVYQPPATNLQEATVVDEEAKEDEPVSMSLHSDAADRALDRRPAHVGLLDDAAPMSRDGERIGGVGALGALVPLPYLAHSGLLRAARKLYGGIGPAFYGLRTTSLTLFLMALLHIRRSNSSRSTTRPPSGGSSDSTAALSSRP
ncbi:MAG: hypothetical protein M0038_14155 [Pseudomonadota bacterium]|jgi:hypothetical protein|nr:hypothetical protein [Pseudomonadota bacterium]